MSKTALLIIADGIEEIEAITPGDVLNRAGVNVTVAGVGTLTPVGGHGIPMRAEMLVEDVGEILFDALILPGGGKGAENLHKSEWVNNAIKRHWEAGKIVAAICASPVVVLYPTGILNGKHATCFPGLERRFGPEVKNVDTEVCVDGRLVTAKGPGVSIPFALRLVEMLCGGPIARDVGRRMVVPHM